MYLHTGEKPSKYAFSLLGLVANGASTLEEIAPILAERERRIALEATLVSLADRVFDPLQCLKSRTPLGQVSSGTRACQT